MDETMPIPELYMEEIGDDYYASSVTPMDGADAAVMMGIFGLWSIFICGVMIVMIIAMWKIFTKAGEEGWKSLIPFYNTWVLLEIAGKPGWWFIWFFIPIANIIVTIMMLDGLSKSFGKGIGYTLGLLFLSPIFFLMLAFGNAKHLKTAGVSDSGNVPPQSPTPTQSPTQETPPQNPTV